MLIYEQLLDLAARIKKVIKNNPDKKIVINMGLSQNIDMERLAEFVKIIEKEGE